MRFWYFLLLFPTVALAKTETWPRLYNDGVTAYHSNDFAHAAQLFESATASPDRTLQQRALYNLGNTNYRLGESQKPQAQQLWQRAIKSYESALALDPQDADAKFNHDFVKKKLEELKKQQQQQQNQQNQQDKKQDQKKDDQQQKQQQQQKQDSQGQPQKPEDKQSEQQKQQQQKSQDQQKQEQQKAEQKQKDEQQKQQAEQQKESPPEQQPQPQSGQPENDEKRQAAALLDNLREDERNWNFFPEVQMKDLKDAGEPAKDW
jgi:Ca-activated chloride channel family protein